MNCFSMCTVSGGVSDDFQTYIPMVCTNSRANGTLSLYFVLNVYYRNGLLCVTLCQGGFLLSTSCETQDSKADFLPLFVALNTILAY